MSAMLKNVKYKLSGKNTFVFMFYAINKPHLSAYLYTPSGKPPQRKNRCGGSVCSFCIFFPIP